MTIYAPTLEKLAHNTANDSTKFGASIVGHEANPDHMRPMNDRTDRMNNEVGWIYYTRSGEYSTWCL